VTNNHTGITVADLVELLLTMPQQAKVFYRDENFGGPDDEFTRSDVDLHSDDIVLIRSPWWQEVD
jgi:hypothetical protein